MRQRRIGTRSLYVAPSLIGALWIWSTLGIDAFAIGVRQSAREAMVWP